MIRVLARALLVTLCVLGVSPSRALAVERFAVLVGSNRGDPGEPELRFAESDAERMYGVLKDVGGFLPENMLLLRGESATVVQRTLISINDRIRTAGNRPNNPVMLLVYYSGHGDAQALHLNRTSLELTLLEQLVRSSAAAFRVLIVDACRSGSLTRVKGGTPAPSFAIRADESLNGEGVVFLTSNSANEDAQESDALGGSFFTHYLRSGLLGPADEDLDGRITLDEAYRYTYANTVRASSRTLAGMQHPTFRYELRGQGKVILSEPGTYRHSRSVLRFPWGQSYLVLERNANGRVVGEVGVADHNRMLSLAPGSYFIRGRGATYLLEGTVEAGAGEFVDIVDSSLDRIAYARLARKGGTNRGSAHGVLAGYSFRTALRNTTSLCHGLFVGYALVLPSITLSPRIEACRGHFRNAWMSAVVDTLDLGLRGAHVWDIGALSLDMGLDAGMAVHQQRFETERIAHDRSTVGVYLGVGLGLAYDIGAGFSVFGESGMETHGFRLQDARATTESIAISIAFRQRLGLNVIW